MPRPDDLVGYSYRAETFCELCLVHRLVADGFPIVPTPSPNQFMFAYIGNLHELETERMLNELAVLRKIDREREKTFDSNDFPKVIFRDQARDSASECGFCCDNLADATQIPVSCETEAR